jgi:alpha-glucuronidase
MNCFDHWDPAYFAWLNYTKKDDFFDEAWNSCLLKVYFPGGFSNSHQSAWSEWQRAILRITGVEATQMSEKSEGCTEFCLSPDLAPESFSLESTSRGLIISGGDSAGLLYGIFQALSLLRRNQLTPELSLASQPAFKWRMLNHWDNRVMDPVHGSIERIKGGATIFDWADMARPNPRYTDYARLLASVGINAVSLNNVNAEPEVLSSESLAGVAQIAAILRQWNIRLFLAVNFGSPVFLGGLPTADPVQPEVIAWWKGKVAEIYSLIPDFGGFIVKADSEGKPGPGTYGRNHVEGSRCLASALRPHGGTLFWRAFIYGRKNEDPTGLNLDPSDRANHATLEFKEWDGAFEANVILQVKCSAIDFQVNEPPHALFWQLPKTPLAVEFSLTKEYSGADTHLAWEGQYLSDTLTFPESENSIATRVCANGSAITAVSNLCNSRNWFGNLLHGSNFFSYGRLAWSPTASPEDSLSEFTELSFGSGVCANITNLLRGSYETVAAYTMPMGLTYLSEFLHHTDPDPWANHKGAGVTSTGIGVNRGLKPGSGYAGLYPGALPKLLSDPNTCPPKWLLYFHHLSWTQPIGTDASPLIEYLYTSYQQGVEAVHRRRRQWENLREQIDSLCWAHVAERLAEQAWQAERWRDLMLRFLEETSRVPAPSTSLPSSPHNRLLSGFDKALADYQARVSREKNALKQRD